MKGNIIDIERFAIHDGPGIRSTVFLKGCPLNCAWCQNPEGISNKINLWYFESKCIHCHRCIDACNNEAIKIGNKNELRIQIAREKCIKNGDCTEVCPTGALAFDGISISSNEVVKILLRDKMFYDNSRGGISISGGDPFYQYEFSLEILKECKNEKINTAIETSLYAKKEIIDKFIGLVDLFIVDLKLWDSKLHKKYTGKANKLIKSNFKYLALKGVKILARIPLIPGITATEANIGNISNFVSEVDNKIKIELINFNKLCQAKYKIMEIDDSFVSGKEPFSKEELDKFYRIIESKNVKVLKETIIREPGGNYD